MKINLGAIKEIEKGEREYVSRMVMKAAYHESGHACTACALGLKLAYMTLTVKRNKVGWSFVGMTQPDFASIQELNQGLFSEDLDTANLAFRKHLTFILGGNAAELVRFGEASPSDRDLQLAYERLQHIDEKYPGEAGEIYLECQKDAVRIVETNFKDMERLAEALFRRLEGGQVARLGGSEIETILGPGVLAERILTRPGAIGRGEG